MEVICHVGAHKTGTTLVQSALRDHRNELMAAGYALIHPRHAIVTRTRMTAAGHCLAVHGSAPGFIGRYRQLMQVAERLPADHVLISHEALLGNALPLPGDRHSSSLYAQAEPMMQLLRDASERPMRLVVYIRAQAGFLASVLGQWGLWKNVDHEGLLRLTQAEQLSWRPAVEAAVRVFGRDRVVVKSFQVAELGPHGHVDEFLWDALGYRRPPGSEPWEGRQSNRSPSALGVELARLMQRYDVDPDQKRAINRFVKETFPSAEGEKYDPIDDDTKARLADLYDADNAALLKEYGPPSEAGRAVV